jgi:hypothetical protein
MIPTESINKTRLALLILPLLVFGIAITVYLTSQQQDTRQKAATPTTTPTSTPVPVMLLLQNPGFEQDTTGWSPVTNARITTNATNVRSGTKAIEIGPGEGAIFQTISVQPGQTYTIQAYGKVSIAGEEGKIGIQILSSSGFTIRDFTVPPLITSTTYTKAELTVTMPTTAAGLKIYAQNNEDNKGVFFVDDFVTVNGSSIPTTTLQPAPTNTLAPTPTTHQTPPTASPTLSPSITTPPTSPSPTTQSPSPSQSTFNRADINKDGSVDLLDFNIWRQEFLNF